MAIRASTEVGPVRVSVRAPRNPKRRTLATGLKLPRKAELPPPVAPAGWYPDPEDPLRMRWWSGVKWTRRFAERGAVATPAVAAGSRTRRFAERGAVATPAVAAGSRTRRFAERGAVATPGRLRARVADQPPKLLVPRSRTPRFALLDGAKTRSASRSGRLRKPRAGD